MSRVRACSLLISYLNRVHPPDPALHGRTQFSGSHYLIHGLLTLTTEPARGPESTAIVHQHYHPSPHGDPTVSEAQLSDNLGAHTLAFQHSITALAKFGKIMSLVSLV